MKGEEWRVNGYYKEDNKLPMRQLVVDFFTSASLSAVKLKIINDDDDDDNCKGYG